MNDKKLLTVILAPSLFIYLIPVLIFYQLFCFHNYDFGLHAQALNLISWSNLDPVMSVYPFYKFRDHFDPILIAFAPLTRLMSPGLALIFVEYGFVIAAAFYFVRVNKHIKLTSLTIFAMFFFLYNKGIFSAMAYPVHPTTWSVLPLMMLCHAVVEHRPKHIILTFLFLCLFREEFPFIGLTLGFYYLCRREFKLGGALIFLATLWQSYVFVFHPMVSPGESANHGKLLLTTIIYNPMSLLGDYLNGFGQWKRLYETLGPALAVILLRCLRKEQIDWQRMLPLLFVLCPLFAIRFLSARWGFHYMPPVIAIFSWMMLAFKTNQTVLPMKYFVILALVMVGFDLSYLKKQLHAYLGVDYGGACPDTKERLVSLNRSIAELDIFPEQKVLISPNLVPKMAHLKYIYPVFNPRQNEDVDHYDAILIEKKYGSQYPLGHEELAVVVEAYVKNVKTEVIIDNPYVYFVRGKFPFKNNQEVESILRSQPARH